MGAKRRRAGKKGGKYVGKPGKAPQSRVPDKRRSADAAPRREGKIAKRGAASRVTDKQPDRANPPSEIDALAHRILDAKVAPDFAETPLDGTERATSAGADDEGGIVEPSIDVSLSTPDVGGSAEAGASDLVAQAFDALTIESPAADLDSTSDARNSVGGARPSGADAISDLVERPGGRPNVALLPHLHGDVSSHSNQLFGDSDEASAAAATAAPASDLSPRARGFLTPTSDGGPPLARPFVVVRLAPEQLQKVREESLVASGERDARTSRENVQDALNYDRWARDCEMRAILGK